MIKKNILPLLCVFAVALAGCGTDTTQIEKDGPDEFSVTVESDLNLFERAWLASKANLEGMSEEAAEGFADISLDIATGLDKVEADLIKLADATGEEATEIKNSITQTLKEIDQNIDEFEDRLDRAEDTEIDQKI